MLAQGIQQYGSLPEKHARVPIEMAGFEKTRGGGGVGLFAEAFYLLWGRGPWFYALWKLDIAVAGFRPARLDPKDHDLSRARGFQSRLDQPDVLPGLADDVI